VSQAGSSIANCLLALRSGLASESDAITERATSARTSLVRAQGLGLERLSEKVQQIDTLRALLDE